MYIDDPRVVVVAADADERALFAECLEDLGARIRLSLLPSGDALLAMLDEDPTGPPDLVFLDVELPDRSGIDVLARLRQDPRWRRLIVLMTTSAWSEDAIEQAYDAGASAFLIKPIRTDALMDQLQRTLEFWLTACQLPARIRP